MAKTGSYRWEGTEKIRKALSEASIEEITEAMVDLPTVKIVAVCEGLTAEVSYRKSVASAKKFISLMTD